MEGSYDAELAAPLQEGGKTKTQATGTQTGQSTQTGDEAEVPQGATLIAFFCAPAVHLYSCQLLKCTLFQPLGPEPCHIRNMEKNISYFVKRYYTDFVGSVKCVDYVGPYMENQQFALKAQCVGDMRRQKPDTTQITYWEWVMRDGDTEVALAHEGYKTRSFDV